MKSINYLGIALVAFTNVALAVDFQQSSEEENLNVTQTTPTSKSLIAAIHNQNRIKSNGNHARSVRESIAPELVGFEPYQKSMQEIITENNQITESEISTDFNSNEIQDDILNNSFIAAYIETICSEKSMENTILQDQLIIENAIINEVQFTASGKSKNKS